TAEALVGKAKELLDAFDEAMDDDFNTALAISQMFALSKEINIYYQEVTVGGKVFDAENFRAASKAYEDMAGIIGIFEQEAAGEDDALVDKLMELIIGIRQDARKEKNWAVADRIRDGLKEAGIVLEDSKSGVRWKRA
ncbi:MAG: cysteine--tRNA ligase, partial [Selenomonadaceae bacterium]|nr:cysteine--tRNA ligase [Selenomonadaceae bacterium]